MLFGGIIVRWNLIRNNLYISDQSKGNMFRGTMLIGLGISLTTHSPLVVLLACMASCVWWMRDIEEQEEMRQMYLTREIFISVFLVVLTVTFRGLNGLIPMG